MSLRDRIFATDDAQRESLEIPEWGVTVEVRGMSGAARMAMMKIASDAEGTVNFAAAYPEIVVGCTFDPETGEQVFDESDKDALMMKSGRVLDKIVETAMRLSGMDDKAVDKAGNDSSATQMSASSTN